jgi:NAD(P)-dependent dehydrogenase (short-subunit alcohol dehydrogenase family)
MQIQGHTFLVTGGGSGLGAACARLLVSAGGNVVVADLNQSSADSLAAELGKQVCSVQADVTDEGSVQRAVQTAASLGGLHGVIHCAGIALAEKVLGKNGPHSLAAFCKVIQVNLIGTFNVARLAAAAMATAAPEPSGERGVLVLTASVAAFEGQIGQAAYAASKSGVVGMTLPVARDLAAIGVRVCTIAPGLIDTPIYGDGPVSDEFKEKLKRDVLFPKRLGVAAEFATLAAEVLANSYLNAEVIRLDGGARLQQK